MKTPLHLAKDKEASAIGLPIVPENEQRERLIAGIRDWKDKARELVVMLETCTKCGACAKACHSYLGTGDHFNIPAARAELFRKLYKRHSTWTGRFAGRLFGADDFDEETISRWVTYFYQCTACRRCAVVCPFGIDTAAVTLAARDILSRMGILPRHMANITTHIQATGNNMGLPEAAIRDSALFLEEEMKEETGLSIRIPVDESGADVLYVPSSADFYVNVDTMMGVAKLFHHLGVKWTVSSSLLEAANFGFFFETDVMRQQNQRLVDAATRLGVNQVILGECGHGWRVAKMMTGTLSGVPPFELKHILEFACENLSRLQFNPLPWKVTLHDSCNYARAGDLIEQPRILLRACVQELVEMTPDRDSNFCCGGGSGLLMDEMKDLRMKFGKIKAEQIEGCGAIDYLAAPCASCKAQLPQVIAHYQLGDIPVGGIMDLIGKTLVMKQNG